MSQAMRKCVLCHMRTTTDQPAHPRLIRAFVVRCLDGVMSLVFVTKISSLLLASVAEHASLSLTWSETSEDTFSHDEAHIHVSVPSNVYAEPPRRTRDAAPCLKLTLVLYMSRSLTK